MSPSHLLRHARRVAALIVAVAIPSVGSAAGPLSDFRAENAAAMNRMMAGMAAPSTGDVDGDFSSTMIAHHQGAIDMARAELRHGRNEQLRRIAQEIIVEQQQEITAMHLAIAPLGRLPSGSR